MGGVRAKWTAIPGEGGCVYVYMLSSPVPSRMEKPPPPSYHKKGSRPRNLQGHVEKRGLVTQDRGRAECSPAQSRGGGSPCPSRGS